MDKRRILTLSAVLTLAVTPFLMQISPAAKPHPIKPASKASVLPDTDAKKGIVDTSYQEVQPLSLLKDPASEIGQKVSFEGTFVTFSPYALDYKPAMRASKDYIAFLIRRPDVTDHIIPLSELKLVYPRKKADQVLNIEGGDDVLVKGKVYSAALGDPWLDVDEMILLKKSPENIAKAKAANKKRAIVP